MACQLAIALPALAQVVPDRTTGTVINRPCDTDCTITGGIRAGNNLFHSFRIFSVRSGTTVTIADPGVNQILLRVTGDRSSNIRGRLSVAGAANLFLINPNGIIFGQDASLDLQGSFVATTASNLQFGRQGRFGTVEPSSPTLLTVDPSAFFFNQRPGAIENHSATGLSVPAGQSLLLLGGDIRLEGGRINSPGSHVELAGLAGSGSVGLNNTHLQFAENLPLANVSIGRSRIEVGNGELEITGRSLSLSNSGLSAASSSSSVGQLRLNLQDQVLILDSNISSDTNDANNAGQITINANAVKIQGSSISTSTQSTGDAGSIQIIANTVDLNSNTLVSTQTNDQGNGGRILIQANNIEIRDSSGVSSEAANSVGRLGNAGKIEIQAHRLVLTTGGNLSTSVDADGGTGGNIVVNVRDLLLLDRQSTISTSVGTPQAGGDGGNVDISSLFIVATSPAVGAARKSSYISANAFSGRGGRVDISTQGLFGLRPFTRTELQALSPANDLTQIELDDLLSRQPNSITAISQGSPQLDGQVAIARPDIDPSRGLTGLPTQTQDRARLIAQSCRAGASLAQGEFVITGRGGLAPGPTDTRSSEPEASWATGSRRAIKNGEELDSSPLQAALPAFPMLLEAQGWQANAQGQIRLVAQVPGQVPEQSPELVPANLPPFSHSCPAQPSS